MTSERLPWSEALPFIIAFTALAWAPVVVLVAWFTVRR
jgi:hypothetical protein